MRNMRHIWFIALNDVRLFVNDRLAVIMFILFPFLFIVMFNFMMGNIDASNDQLELHLVTQETSGISVNLIQSMVTNDRSQLKPGEAVIIWDKDFNQARADVESGKLAGFLTFPADFTQNVESGKPANLEIVSQAEATSTRMALNGLAGGIASGIAADSVEINAVVALLTGQGSSQTEIHSAVTGILNKQMSGANVQSMITYRVESVGAIKSVSASSYVVPGYLVMFVFFAAAMASIDIIRERRNHTLERLIAGSVRKESILGGFFLGGIFRGLVQIIIFWSVYGPVLFGSSGMKGSNCFCRNSAANGTNLFHLAMRFNSSVETKPGQGYLEPS